MDIFQFLHNSQIPFELFNHVAVFTNNESEKLGIGTEKENTKNLFLSDEEDQRFYLLTIQHGKRANLKKFALEIGEKRIHFAGENFLKNLLGLTPGSVTPMGLVNDVQNMVKFYLDSDSLLEKYIFVHPDNNSQTIKLTIEDFKKFIKLTNHELNTSEILPNVTT